MSTYTPYGPGTFTVKIGSATAVDFSGEAIGSSVGHVYSESGEKRTMLNGDIRSAQKVRDPDTVTIAIENDLTAAGLYALLQSNDLTVATVEYTPNTVGAAKWSGDVVLTLPEQIGSDAFGSPIVSEVTWQAVTTLSFTAATTGL